VTLDVSRDTKFEVLLQECMDVIGVEYAPRLLSVFKKHREHQDMLSYVFFFSERVIEDQERTNRTKKALQTAIVAANQALDGVLAAVTIRTLRRTGGGSMGKKSRMKKYIEEKDNPSLPLYLTHLYMPLQRNSD